jgi:hypothetical protein
MLVAWDGFSGQDLSALLGCSLAAARIRLHRARSARRCPGQGGIDGRAILRWKTWRSSGLSGLGASHRRGATVMIDPAAVSMADPLATVDIEVLSASPVFDELFDEIIRGERSPSEGAQVVGPRSRNHRRRRTYAVAAAAAVVVAVTVGEVAVNSGSSVPPGQQSTPWLAARPLPSSGVPATSGTPHSWELVGDIVPTGWQLHTSGPRPGAVACPTTSACYVLGDTATTASGPARYGSFYVSNDFGVSWSLLPVPSGLTAATPLSCPSTLTCDFGALLDQSAVIVTTTDGGHRWTTTPMAGGGQFTALACFPDGACNGLIVAHATGPVSEGHSGVTVQPAIFVRTTDGGATWYRYRLQPLQTAANMSCSDSISCVVHGLSASYAAPYFIVEKTETGGRTWTTGQLPQGFTAEPGISCPTASNCIMAGQTGIPGKTPCVTNSAGVSNPHTCSFGQPTTRGPSPRPMTVAFPGSWSPRSPRTPPSSTL